MADLVEYRQGMHPGPPGGDDVAGAVVDVAEAGKGAGLAVTVAELGVQVEGTLKADRGLLVVGQPVMGVAQAVLGRGLAFAVAQVLQHRQRLPARRQGVVVLTEQDVGPADAAERLGLPAQIAGPAVRVESPAAVPSSPRSST